MIAVRDTVWKRLRRAVHKQGLLPFFRRRLTAAYHRLFYSRVFVWRWRHGEPLVDGNLDLRIERHIAASELPLTVLDDLVAGDGDSFLLRMHEEFSDDGVLWIGYFADRVAGYQWSRRGDRVPSWYFPLTENDVVIFSTVTFYEFRGQNIGPTLMAHICREEVLSEGIATADTLIWNTPAVRFVEKTGFTNLGQHKPLPYALM